MVNQRAFQMGGSFLFSQSPILNNRKMLKIRVLKLNKLTILDFQTHKP
jgi:hypothetical protein